MMIELNGKYVNPENKNYYIEITNGEYIIDYGDGEEIEYGIIEIINNDVYTIQHEDINNTFFKYKIGTIKNNNIEFIYKKDKTTKNYTKYVSVDNNFFKSLKLYKNGTFEFEFKTIKKSLYKGTIYKSGIYEKEENNITLCIKTTYEKNFLNKKINERVSTQLIGDNYFVDGKFYIDENNDLCVIEFKKQ